jgi:hypothetical protein
MIADRITAWALAAALTIAPALADGVSIPGLNSIGGRTSVQFPPSSSSPPPDRSRGMSATRKASMLLSAQRQPSTAR